MDWFATPRLHTYQYLLEEVKVEVWVLRVARSSQ